MASTPVRDWCSNPPARRGKHLVPFVIALIWHYMPALLDENSSVLECFQDLLSYSCRSVLLPALLCLSSHASASGNSTLLQLPGFKHTLIKPCVDTILELNQKLSLRLEMKGFRLKCVFSTIRKTLSHLVMVREISGISQKSSSYF